MRVLSDDVYELIMSYMDKGDNAMKESQFTDALSFYEQALEKLPKEKKEWEVALHIYTALGDCYFMLKEYQQANFSYNRALECPDGLGNGYVWLGVGKSCFEVEEFGKAKAAFISAYMLEGKEIFTGEERKYFMLIKELV